VNQLKAENLMMRAENMQIRQSLTMLFTAVGNVPGLAMMMADSVKGAQSTLASMGLPQVPMGHGNLLAGSPGGANANFHLGLTSQLNSGTSWNDIKKMNGTENASGQGATPRDNGNRAAVRRYREKKKAMDAMRDAEVGQLKAENIMVRAENVQLRHVLSAWMSAKEPVVPGGTMGAMNSFNQSTPLLQLPVSGAPLNLLSTSPLMPTGLPAPSALPNQDQMVASILAQQQLQQQIQLQQMQQQQLQQMQQQLQMFNSVGKG